MVFTSNSWLHHCIIMGRVPVVNRWRSPMVRVEWFVTEVIMAKQLT